jgi:hypothetical protein
MSTTWNPSDKSNLITLSNGNLTADNETTNVWAAVRANISKSTGKWQWEIHIDNDAVFCLGIARSQFPLTDYVGQTSDSWGYYNYYGCLYNNGQVVGTYDTYAVGDTLTFGLDCDAGTLKIYNGGVLKLTATGLAAVPFYPTFSSAPGAATANFGASDFSYPIAGYSGFDTPVANVGSGFFQMMR